MHGGEVAFLVVYIREAHAIDGRSPLRTGRHPLVEEPKTIGERVDVARVCLTKMELRGIPAVVDGMDNAVAQAYAAAPDRLYLIGKDGTVAYQGGRGPFGFLPDELGEAIQKELARGKLPSP